LSVCIYKLNVSEFCSTQRTRTGTATKSETVLTMPRMFATIVATTQRGDQAMRHIATPASRFRRSAHRVGQPRHGSSGIMDRRHRCTPSGPRPDTRVRAARRLTKFAPAACKPLVIAVEKVRCCAIVDRHKLHPIASPMSGREMAVITAAAFAAHL
jgi:hypothetical protein